MLLDCTILAAHQTLSQNKVGVTESDWYTTMSMSLYVTAPTVMLHGWTPLGYLDSFLGGWTPTDERVVFKYSRLHPSNIASSSKFVGPGDELGYHQTMLNLILCRS